MGETEAAATDAARTRREMAEAGLCAWQRSCRLHAGCCGRCGWFGDEDLVSILDYLDRSEGLRSNVAAFDGAHSAQQGTGAWRRLGA
jgi:hypothetical protein